MAAQVDTNVLFAIEIARTNRIKEPTGETGQLVGCLVDNARQRSNEGRATLTKGNFRRKFRRKFEGNPTLIGNPNWSSQWAFQQENHGSFENEKAEVGRPRPRLKERERSARGRFMSRDRRRATESWALTAV